MERKQTSVTISATSKGVSPQGWKEITTETTRITQESRLQRSRRIASQNSTLLRFALSGTIVVLFFGLFLLIGTTDYYNANVQELNWIDENGQFIENSYNLQVSITNDTPLNVLNGLTLNQLFVDNNITQWDSTVTTSFVNNAPESISFTKDIINAGGGLIITLSTFNDFYMTVIPIFSDDNTEMILGGGSFSSAFRVFNYNLNERYSIKFNTNSATAIRLYSSGIGLFEFIDIYLINLNDLGLQSLSQNQLDNYYNIWQENKNSRSLETYNNLGNIPVTNLENMNAILFKPAVDIVNSLTTTASSAAGITIGAWEFVVNIWNRIWGVE